MTFMSHDRPPDEVLPCGCLLRCSLEEGVRTLTLIPCRKDCSYYRATLGLADLLGRPVTHGEAP